MTGPIREPVDGPYFVKPVGFGSRAWLLCGPQRSGTVYSTREQAIAARDRANARVAMKERVA